MTSVAAFGCGEDEANGGGGSGGDGGSGGQGGSGGTIGPLVWTSSNLTILGDDNCEFFDETVSETFVMNIDGSELTLEQPNTDFILSTNDYSPTDDVVVVMGSSTNNDNAPCEVQLNDDMTLNLDDASVSIDQNDTLTVSWFHDEEELSSNECAGVWFVDLPCFGEAELTLTKQ